MLTQVADGVFVRQSRFMMSNAVAVQGAAGFLVIDPGVLEDELIALVHELGQPVVAGFSTHPHWDHLLWHAELGAAPRHATARCAATVRERLPDDAAKVRARAFMPPDIVDDVPLDRLGELTPLPEGATEIPWDGPRVRIVEHSAHAAGHASLLVEERGVLVAGDLLSDVLIPMLDLSGAVDPVGDYLAGLESVSAVADEVDVVVPGHGSVGRDVRARLEHDRTYLRGLRTGAVSDDHRLDADAYGREFLPAVHQRQVEFLAARGSESGTNPVTPA